LSLSQCEEILAESTEGKLRLAEGEASRARLHVRLGLEAQRVPSHLLKARHFRRRLGPTTRGSAALSAIKSEDRLPFMHEPRALELRNLLKPSIPGRSRLNPRFSVRPRGADRLWEEVPRR